MFERGIGCTAKKSPDLTFVLSGDLLYRQAFRRIRGCGAGLFDCGSHALVGFITNLGVCMVLFKDSIDNFGRILLIQRVVTDFALEEADKVSGRLFGVEGERVLTFGLKIRVEAVQVPVSACDGVLLMSLCRTHAGLDAVVDAGCIADDD